MLARASLATTMDSTYRGNVRHALLAGIPVVGAYHFMCPDHVVSPVEQARLFIDRIQDPDGLLAMLDVEKDRNPKTGEIFVPTISDARAFAGEFARLTGGHTMIMYAPGWYCRGYIGDPAASDLGPLCASRYVEVDPEVDAHGHRHPIRMTPGRAFEKVPPSFWSAKHGGWKKATLLQFTSWGNIDGYGGRVDLAPVAGRCRT